MMDEFLIRYQLHSLGKTIDANKAAADQHLARHDSDITSLNQRVGVLENKETESSGMINTLRQQVTDLQKMLSDLTMELYKTKLINLKQDIVIRTLHNMQAFDAYDMFVDTFATPDGIDFAASIRAEWMPDHQAVGKTRKSVVEIQQLSSTSNFLIAKNGLSDEAIAQSFILDKKKQVDKVSVVVSRFNDNTSQPLIVSIRATIDGPDLTNRDVWPNEAIGGFIDVELPDYMLNAGDVYYLVLRTNDTHGYRIGVDTVDKYLGGTSFSLYNNVWIDNNHDIAFKIWCFPSEDENNATIISVPKTLDTMPKSIVFEREETLEAGSGINYFVSRDGGMNWKLLQPGIVTSLDDLPPGNKLVLKAYILGASRIEAWGYVVTRGDV